MKHEKRIGPWWEYDEEGKPTRSLGDVEWHYVSQRDHGRLAASWFYLPLDRVDDRRLQAFELRCARGAVRDLIAAEG